MITVEEAKKIITNHHYPYTTVSVKVSDALGYYLAEDIVSPIHIPLFDQSAMDGYAFCWSEIDHPLTIVDEIPAGDTREIATKQNEAVRIYTGSKVPKSCDTVVMQELTTVKNNVLQVNDKKLKLGANIRKQGEQIHPGTIALKKGTKITPATIGFLSTLGLSHVKVTKKPRVMVISTGNELKPPGSDIKLGEVYESNTAMLLAALRQIMVSASAVHLNDDKQRIKTTIKDALDSCDMIILTGGISVGDYDFVKEALEENLVKTHFHKVKQKPGKPLYFGTHHTTAVFALPGNPAAAMTCFYEYIYPYIQLCSGLTTPFLTTLKLPLETSYTKKTGRAIFLKASASSGEVKILDGQGSDALQSFTNANCLVYLPENIATVEQKTMVEVHLLP